MSHFTVLVIGEDIEAALAPFQENNMGDCPKQYLAFNDEEDEYRKEYDTDGTEMVRLEDGSVAYPWDDRFRIPGSFGIGSQTHKVPDHLKLEQVPHKNRFATFEQFVSEYYGRKERDPEKGRFGYWENPNAKWDWYLAGGRWDSMLIDKRGASHNSIRVKNLDLEAMRRAAEQENMPLFDRLLQVMAGRPIPSWNEVRESHGENIDAARAAYHALPEVKDINADETLRRCWVGDLRKHFCNGDREAFRQQVRRKAFVTHAVLKDGQWYERGKMGWFATVADDKGDAWDAEFEKLIESLSPKTVITVVDCHI